MKTAAQQPGVFRLRRKTGLTTMRDVWSFAHWIADRTGQTVVIEGVSRVRAGHLGASVPLATDARTVSHDKPAEIYRPRQTRGLALKSDLHALARWLAPVLAQQDRSDDKRVNLRRAAAGRLPLPSGIGLLLREEFLAFAAAVGARLGFQVEAQDIAGSRETGAGIHVSRRSRSAGIIVRSQPRYGYGKICAAFPADDPGGDPPGDPDDGNVVTRVRVTTFETGSTTETWTASGTVQGIGPGGTFDDCADVDYDITGSGSGAQTDVSVTDTIEPWDDVIAAAEAEIDDDGSPVDIWSDTWEETEWRTASAPRSEFIEISYNDRSTGFEWEISAPKIQIENTGQTRLEVEITFTRLSDSETETLEPVIVEPGQTSDWIDTRAADPFETWNCHITRVGMGGF